MADQNSATAPKEGDSSMGWKLLLVLDFVIILLLLLTIILPMAGVYSGSTSGATTCADDNPCTSDYTDSSGACVHDYVSGSVAACSGSAGICLTRACVEGSCVAQKVPNCCGNYVCEEAEDYLNCPIDCNVDGSSKEDSGGSGITTYEECDCSAECHPQSGVTNGADCDCTEIDCTDGIDNDADGLIDCLDPDCDCLPEDCPDCPECEDCPPCGDECGDYPDCRGECYTEDKELGNCIAGNGYCYCEPQGDEPDEPGQPQDECGDYPECEGRCTTEDQEAGYCREGKTYCYCDPVDETVQCGQSAPECNGECSDFAHCGILITGGCGCIPDEETNCDDGKDNDGDQLVDCDDPDCEDDEDCLYTCGGLSPNMCSAGTCPPGQSCIEGYGDCRCVETELIPCEYLEAPECGGKCEEGYSCVDYQGSCMCDRDSSTCEDGIDNDGDGLIDCDDDGCQGYTICDFTCEDYQGYACWEGTCPSGEVCATLSSYSCGCIPDDEYSCGYIEDTAYCSEGTCPSDEVCQIVGNECGCAGETCYYNEAIRACDGACLYGAPCVYDSRLQDCVCAEPV